VGVCRNAPVDNGCRFDAAQALGCVLRCCSLAMYA
jgi:hypothetical protein